MTPTTALTEDQKAAARVRATEILRLAFIEMRSLGLAPVFKWGKNYKGDPWRLATNIDDFDGFHEVN